MVFTIKSGGKICNFSQQNQSNETGIRLRFAAKAKAPRPQPAEYKWVMWDPTDVCPAESAVCIIVKDMNLHHSQDDFIDHH